MKERDALYSKLFWTSSFQNAFRGTPCKEIDCPGLVDFAIGLVNSVLNLPNGQVMCFEEFKLKKSCEINSARQRAFGASWNDVWASNAFFSLPEWQAVKMTFFAPWRNDTLSSRYATKLLAKHTHTHTHIHCLIVTPLGTFQSLFTRCKLKNGRNILPYLFGYKPILAISWDPKL